jgi:hypothetical protein
MKITLKNSEPIIASFRSAAYQVRQTPAELVSTQLCLPPSSHSEEGETNIPCISPLRDFEENCYELVVASSKIKIPYNSLLRELEGICYKLLAASDTNGGLDSFSRRNHLKKVLTMGAEYKRDEYQLSSAGFSIFLTRVLDNYLTHRP